MKRYLFVIVLLALMLMMIPNSVVIARPSRIERIESGKVSAILRSAGLASSDIEELEPWLASWVAVDLENNMITPEAAKARIRTVSAAMREGIPNESRIGPPPRTPPPMWGHYSGPDSTISSSSASVSSTCKQAWNGPGTGAWYRVDSECANSNWYSTSARGCWGDVTVGDPKDGFFLSLGIYNTVAGNQSTAVAADVGFEFMPDTGKWGAYAADELGWHFTNVHINPTNHPCVDLSLLVTSDATLIVTDPVTGVYLDGHTFSDLDPDLKLNADGNDIGYYRFDSIAEPKGNETLDTGSRLNRQKWSNWNFHADSGSVLATPTYVWTDGTNAPGPCCSDAEESTITVYSQSQWYTSDVTIYYPQ